MLSSLLPPSSLLSPSDPSSSSLPDSSISSVSLGDGEDEGTVKIGTLEPACDQAYAEVTIIIGSDVGQQNNGDTATTFFP